MTADKGDPRLFEFQPTSNGSELNLGTRVDRDGRTTYHVISSDRRIGVFLEKIYNEEHKLVRIQKRSQDSRSETFFDATTGAITQIFETAALPDGDTLTKNTTFYDDNKSSEDVVVMSPNGELVRRLEREIVGIRTLFQGQTDYNADGTPATTVNHRMDKVTGNVIYREQIQWLSENQRSLTEEFFFDNDGNLIKYNKILFNAKSGPLLEEQQTFDPENHNVVTREIKGYNTNGAHNCSDYRSYRPNGKTAARRATFFDEQGNSIGSRDCI